MKEALNLRQFRASCVIHESRRRSTFTPSRTMMKHGPHKEHSCARSGWVRGWFSNEVTCGLNCGLGFRRALQPNH